MAKKQVATKRNRNQKKHQTHKTNKNENANEASQIGADDSSSEENAPIAVVESSDGVEDRVAQKKSKNKGEEEKKPHSINRKIETDDAKASKGKKRSKEEDDDAGVMESEAEEKSEHALYTFPMNRVSRIIRSENPDIRISQEAVFLINRASKTWKDQYLQLMEQRYHRNKRIFVKTPSVVDSIKLDFTKEKFLQVFCREAYACLFLEGKSYSAYNHLSSVVAKRKRFRFLSDFVPEKVKSEDALAQTPEAET